MNRALYFLIILLLPLTLFAQVDLNLGLRAYYPFSGNANDISGNNNNPVFNNATLTADRFGTPNSAYHFNGSNNYMQIPNSASLNMTNTLSIALWVKPTGWYTGQCYNNMMLTKGDADNVSGRYSSRFSDVYTGCSGSPSTTNEKFFDGFTGIATTPTVQLNQWYSVVITFDGTTSRLYVDCVLRATTNYSNSFTNSHDLFIGHLNNVQFPYWLNGDLDEIRIYDRALNQDEVNTLGGCTLTTTCNNWLSTPSNPSYVTTGDIDVTGNQLTVEATVNRKAPLNGGQYYGHIVSKHTGPANVNYALSLTGCEITTTNGYKFTDPICDPGLDKTYHIAMVYNGSTLRFYRNGFLMSSVPCTGNMVTNDLLTTIGEVAGNGYPFNNQFVGHINEVRIWNVARTQAQLQTYMNSSLPNPTTQTGLQAYYTFNNLVNQQGNNAFNGVINGAATINASNPNCSFVADSCAVVNSCNNWLSAPTFPSTASIGNLNVTGNQITVEGNFYCTAFSTPGFGGNLVAKHTNAANTCYALSPHAAEISTSNNGYVAIVQTCPFELNKNYHVAMVYDGASLKFYRNGFLMSQTACSGTISSNSFQTIIGNGPATPLINQFFGNINEIRIWNVARTQAQLRAYMNTSLPNPTTQPGLLAYYTFDNLLNKQGNAAWNATLSGGTSINATVPTCSFVADSCNVLPPPPVCKSSFEFTKANSSYVRILPSAPSTYNQLYNSNGFSWETWFKLTGPITNLSTIISTEDAVLFHDIFLGFGWGSIPNALCFLVSDNGANNATVYAESLQSLTVGTWYHVAAVCDYANGILRLYLNGNQIATKTIPVGILNDRLTTNVSTQIGNASSSLIYGINATVDETRFWNTVRNQSQIQASMNQCLSNPQAGLVAYFKADELTGNTAASAVNNNFSGSLSNTTWSTQTPSVNCGTCVTSSSVIINDYTPILGLNPCDNKVTVENATAYNIGDTVLLIQMKGALIDSTNTAAFGNIVDYKNAGNYEYNYVKSKTGNVIELKNTITRQYDVPVGKVQLIRVPYYANLTTTDTLTCLPWDGSKGGVLVFNVQNTLTLNQPLDVSGKGFKGGIGFNPGNGTLTCFRNNYFYAANTIDAAYKGESISAVSTNRIAGKGKLASGGGGGAGHNSGGGGGGNAGTGGFGGYQLNNCGSAPFDNRGIGGIQLPYSTASNRIFMGGGGGAGHQDNPGNVPSAGGNGAGIIIVNADMVQSNGKKIIANGGNAVECSVGSSPDCHDAMGGGGAGGTVLLSVNQYLDNAVVENKGGKGADVTSGNIAVAGRIGPGGGGGGGLAFLKTPSTPANLSITNTGGINGVLTQDANNAWGATVGTAGQNIFNLVLPIDNTPFQKNIDSVRIKDSVTACLNVDFKGFGYTNTNPINSWQWYFGDAGTANTQNTTHTYATAGTFTVKLVVTDINGCKDSITKAVTVNVCSNIIINDYTPVLALDPCKNILTVENATAYNVGDTVLLIQMKGAEIDSTNTAAFGTITNYKNAGNYEFNYIRSKAGNDIELSNVLTRQYDVPVGRVQLIRVPYYNGSFTLRDTLTCLPWDGRKGGVVVLNVRDTVHLNNEINVSGKGFLGAQAVRTIASTAIFHQADYAYPANTVDGSRKGEGISEVSDNLIFCRGPLASGAGGGNSSNSGGGGGGNGGTGGKGGNEWGGTSPIATNGGLGGKSLIYNGANNKIFMGGAGGAGQNNDATATNGGNGGGLVIINTNTINPNANKIVANGATGVDCLSLATCADGVGGGGAGGSILVNAQSITSSLTVQANGGRGANNNIPGPNAHGPGGGAGGGSLLVNGAGLLTNINYTATGGAAGIAFNHGNTNWGAVAGSSGISASNFIIPFATVPFKINIDSVRIKDSILSCNDFDFKGLAYINSAAIASWQWYFGDGGQATTQNTTHSYSTAGTYTVKLVVIDINGCRDSITKNVNALPAVTADAGPNVSICSNGTVSVTLNGSAVGGPYSWSPAIYLNNPNISNPTATISSTTTFYLSVVGSPSCTAVDSVIITIDPIPLVDTRPDTTICRLAPLVLTTSSNATTIQWSPAGSVSNPNIASPNFIGTSSGWVYVTGSFASGCFAKDSLYVTVNPIPVIDTRIDTTICLSSPLVLTTTSDATTFQWSPAVNVSNATIASPNYIGTTSGWMYVTGYFASGCSATDSLYVTVNPLPVVDTRPDTSICRAYPLVLSTNSNATSFQWSPASSVNNPNIASPDFIGTSSGWVYVTASFATGCTAKDSLYVTINPTPVVDTRTDTAICRSSPLVLTTSSDATFIQWSPAASVSNPNIASPNFIGNTSGWVYVTGSFASGCAATDSLYVTVNPIPLVDTRVDTTICRLSPLVLNTNTNATSFQWTPAISVNNPGIANPNFIGNNSGWVYVTGSTAAGCFAKDSLYVTVNQLPVVQSISDSTICLGQSITLTTTGAQTYSWSPSIGLSNPNIASPVFSGSSGQNYTVTGTDANGCKNTDLVSVVVVTPPAFKAPPEFTICEKKSVTLDGNNDPQFNYLWSPATYLSNANVRNPIANPPQTTLYTLVVSEKRCGFNSTFTSLLTVVPAPVINARKSNDIDCAFRSATLFASGGNQYLWSPSTGLNDPTIATPVAIPANTQTYTVLVTNATGCTNTDTVTVVIKNAASLARFMPNAFTPDGNGTNDCYGLKNWMYVRKLQFFIFNRFGEQVFGTANPNICWDGTYKGKPALAGTYVFVIKAETDCGIEEQKGNFLLIR